MIRLPIIRLEVELTITKKKNKRISILTMRKLYNKIQVKNTVKFVIILKLQKLLKIIIAKKFVTKIVFQIEFVNLEKNKLKKLIKLKMLKLIQKNQ